MDTLRNLFSDANSIINSLDAELSLNTLLMAPEATLPPGDVNAPGDYFSLAGFEVNIYGRFWLTPEDIS